MKTKRESGFTLIELMIVIAIIGILAAVAVPMYNDYIGQGQMSEPLNIMVGAKEALNEYYGSNGAMPADINEVFTTSSGSYTQNVQGNTTADNYVITATMKAAGVNPNIAGNTVSMKTSDGGKQWQCGPGAYGTAVAAKYLPASCRETITP